MTWLSSNPGLQSLRDKGRVKMIWFRLSGRIKNLRSGRKKWAAATAVAAACWTDWNRLNSLNIRDQRAGDALIWNIWTVYKDLLINWGRCGERKKDGIRDKGGRRSEDHPNMCFKCRLSALIWEYLHPNQVNCVGITTHFTTHGQVCVVLSFRCGQINCLVHS